ncbi:hypothetical protein [Streptomyces bohaiensis]|uniref:Peptidase n=1 Tax=Streptomyces bohaiensis TaxID=1431344 RepID=A0ABX1C5V9_9ACTN|nr:hypothetical protein [Streptomyces bohaiensis]NJQ14582.1 hypothetical protein [Streptomyces bohaiensis]
MSRHTTVRHRARRVGRPAAVLALAAGLLLGTAPAVLAQEDGESAGEQQGSDGGSTDPAADPTEAGTGFRDAAVLGESGRGTARATVGEFLYWAFPVAAGHDATVDATVTFEDDGDRSGPSVWQIDVHDGLRRKQSCVGGDATVEAAADAAEVTLGCALRTVRSWAEPWSGDPLPGAYYVRLTAVELPEEDLGLPVSVVVRTTTEDAGGAHARGGELGAPLVPTPRAGSLDDGAGAGSAEDAAEDAEESGSDADAADPTTDDGVRFAGVVAEPEGGWNGGWWSDRWLWTAGGGVLGALAALGGYALVRHPRVRG